MTRNLLPIAFGMSAVSGVVADAPVELFGLPETVTIATGREESVRTAPAVATVITAEDIRNYGIRNVVEALRLVPGLHQGLLGSYQPIVTVRGFSSLSSNNILFLLDGIAQTDLLAGDQIAVLGRIPLDAIERIEVTRGPGSSVFGADAFSAVVNIVTRTRAEGPKVALSGGSFDTSDGRLLAGFNDDRSHLVLALEGMQTDGPAPLLRVDRQAQLDARMGTSASLAPANLNTARQDFGALLNLSFDQTSAMFRVSRWNDIGQGTGLGGTIDPVGTRDYETAEARIAQQLDIGAYWGLTLTADAAQTKQTLSTIMFLAPGAFRVFKEGAFLSTEVQQQFLRLHADSRYDGFTRHYLTAGIGYEHAAFDDTSATLNYLMRDTFIIPTRRTTYHTNGSAAGSSRQILYGYVQDEWLLAPKWALT